MCSGCKQILALGIINGATHAAQIAKHCPVTTNTNPLSFHVDWVFG